MRCVQKYFPHEVACMNAPERTVDSTPATVEFSSTASASRPSQAKPSCRRPSAQGVEIPRLCYKAGYRPDGNCRACMVEIDGERVLAPSLLPRASQPA